MSPGERDKKMNEIASKAAAVYCRHANDSDEQIEALPETYLQHSIPYLTVRTLQRHEDALKGLKSDSRWIKWFTIVTGCLTLVLAGLTVFLAIYARRLDELLHSLR